MFAFQALILHVASPLHLPLPCRQSEYHFTSLCTVPARLIIPHPFPSIFPFVILHLVLCVLFVITAPMICSHLVPNSHSKTRFSKCYLRDIWQTWDGKSGMKKTVKYRGWAKHFSSYAPPPRNFSSCTYRMSSIKLSPPKCFGFAPRHKVFRDILLHCGGRFPVLLS